MSDPTLPADRPHESEEPEAAHQQVVPEGAGESGPPPAFPTDPPAAEASSDTPEESTGNAPAREGGPLAQEADAPAQEPSESPVVVDSPPRQDAGELAPETETPATVEAKSEVEGEVVPPPVTSDTPDAGSDPTPVPTTPPRPGPPPVPAAPAVPRPAPTPAVLAGRAHPPATPGVRASQFGRVADDGTVYVTTPEGEKEVGSYPGATPEEALAYFTRKYDEADAQADLLLQRVTQTDLSSKEAADGLAKMRATMAELRAVGDLVALNNKVENVATAVDARRALEAAERAQAKEHARSRRLEIVEAAERLAGQPEDKIQWKSSSAQMRTLLDDWKTAQREGPKLDRDVEQELWHRLSSARNSFDKLRRVHFAQLGSAQNAARSTKEELVAEAERLAQSTEWGPTAGAFKRLMDRWRQAGRASRADDDALWARFKGAQDAFFAAKDSVAAQENEEFTANLAVKESLLVQAQALLPVKDLEAAKAALRVIQDKWDAAGKVPRADLERIEKGMRRVEAAVRDAEDRRWHASNPEAAARAQSLVTQLESACEGLRADLAKAEAGGDARRVAKAREALEAREAWLAQARAGLAEFGG